MRPTPRSTVAAALVLSCFAVPMMTGCVVGMGGCDIQSARFTREQVLTLPHVAGTGLDVRTENGKIVVHRGGTDAVTIKATIRATSQERADGTKITAGRSAGADQTGQQALVVRVDWAQPKRDSNEGCSIDITIPETAWVRLESSNGGVVIENLSGAADLKTSNSSIQVVSHTGDVQAKTSNSSISADKVSGSIVAETTNSGITASEVNGPVQATTSNGSIRVSFASGAKGPVRAKTSNSSINLSIPESFEGALELKTSNGTIRSEGFSNSAYAGSRTAGVLRLSDSAAGQSTATTSNGSIHVERR